MVLAGTAHYDITEVTESWLSAEKREFIAYYKLPGFTKYSCEAANRLGGYVTLYIRNTLKPISVKTRTVTNVEKSIRKVKVRKVKVNLTK